MRQDNDSLHLSVYPSFWMEAGAGGVGAESGQLSSLRLGVPKIELNCSLNWVVQRTEL